MPSPLTDFDSTQSTEFRGPNYLLDEEDVVAPEALDAQNIEFISGQVRTRRGFSEAFPLSKLVTTIYNWVQQQYNRLIRFEFDDPSDTTGNVISRDLVAETEVTVLSGITAKFLILAQLGYRIIMGFVNSDGTSTNQAQIWDGTFTSAVPNVDIPFHPPLLSTEISLAFGEPLAGVITAGTHYVAVIVNTWNGFTTPPGPIGSGSLLLEPLEVVAAGGMNLEIQVTPTPTWGMWVRQIQIAMTPVANPDRWFLVPGAISDVARGSAFPITITFDIDDVTLQAAEEITDTLMNIFFSTKPLGLIVVIPKPHVIVPYNDRMVWVFRTLGPDLLSIVSQIMISKRLQPQYVLPESGFLNLPEFRDCTFGFTLGQSLYLGGPGWTYAYSDNLREPVEWSAPRLVSGEIGTPWARGVVVNAGQGYCWIMSLAGLYYFSGGVFPRLPASYEQSPIWKRINFAAGQENFEIKENVELRQVLVRAMVASEDGESESVQLMVWDYTDGFVPGKIKFCGMWPIGDASYKPGAMEMVIHPTRKNKEFWVARGDTAGTVLRQKYVPADATLAEPGVIFSDQNSGIDSYYHYGSLTRLMVGTLQHMAGQFRIRGEGTINLTAFSLDRTRSVDLAPIDLSLLPGETILRWLDMQSEGCSLKIDNGASPGAYFFLSAIKWYWKLWMSPR